MERRFDLVVVGTGVASAAVSRWSQAMLAQVPRATPCRTIGTARTLLGGICALDRTKAIPYPARARATRVSGAPLSSSTWGRRCAT